jgi:hypothetical protein
MTPERKYTLTGDRLLSEEPLTVDDRRDVLSLGINFISREIGKNTGISGRLGGESEDFQKYLPYATLARLVHLYEKSKEDNIFESTSVRLFGEMKKYFSEKLNLSVDDENEKLLEEKITQTMCCSQDIVDEDKYIDELGQNGMRLISIWAAEIVPDNPKKEIYMDPHKLD